MDRTDRLTRYSRRTVLASGVALAVGLAGCQSDGDGDPDGNATDGDDGGNTTDNNGTATPEPLEFPAGTSEDGIEATPLVEATDEALTNNDYAMEVGLAQTGSEDLDVTQRLRSSLADERRLLVFDANTETNRIFIADDTRYFKSTSDGETTYGSGTFDRSFSEAHEPEMLGGAESLGGILETGSYTPAGTVRKRGVRVLKFTLDSATLSGDETTLTDSEGAVFVDGDGVVREASMSLEFERSGTAGTIDQSFVVTELGDVDVEEPDWVETAREQSS